MNKPVTPPPPPPRPNDPANIPPRPPMPAQRAEATFNSALERPPGQREAYIAQACGDDTVPIGEVRGLLAAHEGAGDFLKTDAPLSPEIEAELAQRTPEEAGERIGCDKPLQEIGEAGASQ